MHTLSGSMSVTDWTFFFHQNNTGSHDRGNETWDAHESFFGTDVLISKARLPSCEPTGLIVTEQLCSAKADVSFWDTNWSHVPELQGRHLTWLQKMAPVFLPHNCHFSVSCFLKACVECFSPVVLSHQLARHSSFPALYLCVIVYMRMIIAATIDAWKPLVSDVLFSL